MACEHATKFRADGRRGLARHRSRPGLAVSLALNAVALGALWLVYTSVRTVTANSWSVARSNAQQVMDFQNSLGVPSEAVFQAVFLDYEWLLRAANIFYMSMHFPAMIALLVWALIARREAMARIRLALIGSTLVGLFIHLAFPLAPPRMLGLSGFVDTASLLGPDPYALGIARAANELAAMPSMHVGWALLIALAVINLTSSRLRWLILAHPLITSFVVVVTANHYWTDVVVGALLGSVGWWMARLVGADPAADPLIGLVELEAEMCESELVDLTV